METKNNKSQPSSPRAKVWASLVTTTLGAVASLISAAIGTSSLLNVSKEWTATITAVIATIAISAGLTSILSHRERGSLRIARLKDQMSAAYLDALDNSTLNPRRGEER